jgi:hypothetical protein
MATHLTFAIKDDRKGTAGSAAKDDCPCDPAIMDDRKDKTHSGTKSSASELMQ